MRQTVLGFVCLTLVCITHESGSAHEPVGRGFAAKAGLVSSAAFRRPQADICEGADCILKPGRGPGTQRRTIFRYNAPPAVLSAIAAASVSTGVDRDYMLRAAALESSLNPFLEAQTSTATGLYQFVEQTWFHMLRSFGSELGLRDLSAAIMADKDGYEVDDPEMREEILALRYDPWLSAFLAGIFTRHNAVFLTRALGREPDAGELYLTHVLGASGGTELIRLAERDPGANACKYFSRAARANRSIFYDGRRPRTVEEVYVILTGKYFNVSVHAEEAEPWGTPMPDWAHPPLPIRLLSDPLYVHAMR